MSAAPNGRRGGRKMERTLATDRCMLPTLQVKGQGSKDVCVCACVCVCVCACVHVCVHACVCVCQYIRTQNTIVKTTTDSETYNRN